jgi:hypothetical protein
MFRYHITGDLEYLQFCPKAPGVDLCDPPQSCPGHPYPALADCYVDAPDEARAQHAALKKLAGAYPWPLFDATVRITVCDAPTSRGTRDAQAILRGEYLPGFQPDEAPRSVTLEGRDGTTITLTRQSH